MLTWISKNIFHPLWDFKDKSARLKTLRELEETQWLSEKELKVRQLAKLKNMLQYAYENCAYYRMLLDEKRIYPSDIHLPRDLSRIPFLTKKHIQDNINGLIAKQYTKDRLIRTKTGGSTGAALALYFDPRCQAMRNAAAMRSDRWAQWDLGAKRAAVWGNPPRADTIKKKIRNTLLDRIIFLDTMNLNDKSMGDFVKACRRYKPAVIFGHSHSIFMFAEFIEGEGITDILPKGIITSSMMLMPHEREVIERVFHCKVTNRYGCEEVGLIACECENHNGMHLNIDHLYIEFIKPNGLPATPGEEGEIVVTDLINRAMPLIRYRIEDLGIPSQRRCSCGRGLPLMDKVTGRVADFLVRKDGSLVAGVSLVERTLTSIKGIEQMQVVQEAINTIRINMVRGREYNMETEKLLLDEFKRIFGRDIHVTVNYVNKIPQERSGKYRFSICKIPYSPGRFAPGGMRR